MMSEKFDSMIFAYSIGCLNHESKAEFHKYLASGEEFNFPELGEIQNLAALIPIALEIEEVSTSAKNSVAKRLYGLRNDIKKIRAQYNPQREEIINQPVQEIVSEPSDDMKDAEDIQLTPIRIAEVQRPAHDTQIRGRVSGNLYTPYTGLTDDAAEKTIKRTSEIINTAQDIMPEPEAAPPAADEHLYKGPVEKSEAEPKKNYSWMILSFILFFIIVLGVVFIYFRITSDLKNTKKELDTLKNQVTSQTMQKTGSSEIEQILQSPNAVLINLKGTDLNPSGFGKIFIDRETGKGLIQFSQMPALSKEQVYVLWLDISGSFIQLGSYTPIDDKGYYKFNVANIEKGMDVNFFLTKENSASVKHPGSKVFLNGSL